MHGWPSDYDEWAAAGNPGWTFEELLPVVCAVESDQDFRDEWHGNDGLIPITRLRPDELDERSRAFAASATACGHAVCDDHNRPRALGVGPWPRNVRDGLRMSTALTCLAAARARPTLEIRADTTVDRIEVEHGRARGVRLQGGEVVEAGTVVLAGGTYAGPAILLRSGIGPAAQLREFGLPVTADLPGVGANLVDHPLVAVDLPVAPGRRGPTLQVVLTMRFALADPEDPPDLQLFTAGPFDDAAIPSGGIFAIVAELLAPRARGSLQLRSADPAAPRGSTRPTYAIPTTSPRWSRPPASRARSAGPHRWPTSSSVRRSTLETGSGTTTPTVSRGRSVAGSARVTIPSGPARWVRTPGTGAVVNSRGAVHGIARLYVVDASVMPTIPAANTNLPTIVVAERIASWLGAS